MNLYLLVVFGILVLFPTAVGRCRCRGDVLRCKGTLERRPCPSASTVTITNPLNPLILCDGFFAVVPKATMVVMPKRLAKLCGCIPPGVSTLDDLCGQVKNREKMRVEDDDDEDDEDDHGTGDTTIILSILAAVVALGFAVSVGYIVAQHRRIASQGIEHDLDRTLLASNTRVMGRATCVQVLEMRDAMRRLDAMPPPPPTSPSAPPLSATQRSKKNQAPAAPTTHTIVAQIDHQPEGTVEEAAATDTTGVTDVCTAITADTTPIVDDTADIITDAPITPITANTTIDGSLEHFAQEVLDGRDLLDALTAEITEELTNPLAVVEDVEREMCEALNLAVSVKSQRKKVLPSPWVNPLEHFSLRKSSRLAERPPTDYRKQL